MKYHSNFILYIPHPPPRNDRYTLTSALRFISATMQEYLNTNENLVQPQWTFVASEICIRSNPASLHVMVLIN